VERRVGLPRFKGKGLRQRFLPAGFIRNNNCAQHESLQAESGTVFEWVPITTKRTSEAWPSGGISFHTRRTVFVTDERPS
jgi:hypothetical protein